ncbi:MAG: glycosyltransferase [Xanthomonadales bacterium]|nr:glycosyltransferase [Xanthomonadales bacterium]
MSVPAPDSPVCTVILPVFNGLSYVIDGLEALFRWTDLDRHRLLVVDDASDRTTGACLDRVAGRHAHVDVLRNETNLGFLRSCNRAIAASETDAVVLLNSDVVVTPGWLDRLLACLGTDTSIASVNPLTNRAAQIALPMVPGANFLGMDERLAARPVRCRDVVTGVGFCMLLRRRALDEVGLFDEVYGRGYCEESDLCMRLVRAGWRTVVAENVYVYHRGGVSFADRDARYTANRQIFDKRWKREYRRQFRQFRRADPLGPVRGEFALPERWNPKPMVWQTARAMLAAKARCDYAGVVEQSVRGLVRTLRSRQPVARPDAVRRVSRRDRLSVTYVLSDMVIAGGVLSVIQLVNELILQGVEARIVTLFEDPLIHDWTRLYTRPIVFRSRRELLENFPETDIAVATLWKTAPWVADLVDRGRAAHGAYFLQDYEPWFFPESQPEARQRVRETFGLLPNRIVKSDWLQGKLAEDGFDSHKIRLGMDLGRFYRRDVERTRPTIMAMARPGTAYRGFPVLVEALSIIRQKYPESEIILFGSRDLADQDIPFEFRDMGVIQDMDRMAEMYSRADLFIDTSDFQGFGRCGLEAMACGAACVLSNAGGVNEYAVDGGNALLVAPGATAKFAAAVTRLLDDRELRERLVEGGLATAREFDHKREARETRAYFESLV